MDAEIATYARELRWILEQIVAAVEGLTPAQLAWRPSTGDANSPSAIISHVVGSTRVYVLGFGCGRPVARDRRAEFAASGADTTGLVAGVRQLSAEIESALASLPPGSLDRRIRPPQELWGTGDPREISAREAFVEGIRHAALHLGELRLTRDLALQR